MTTTPRSLVLVTIDCLRADHVGHLGYRRATTPFLDCLATEGIVFTNAIAAGAPTYYSLPALMASRFPLAFGRDLIGIAPGETTLASALQECGFATAAFSSANPYVSARFGYDQGFDTFSDFLDDGGGHPAAFHSKPRLRTRVNQMVSTICHSLPGLGAAYDEAYFGYCQKQRSPAAESFEALRRFPSADIIVDHAVNWLNENSSRPFFLWLHLMDPHAPYFPKPEALELMEDGHISGSDARYANSYWARTGLSRKRLTKKRDLIMKLYDAGIRWADTQIRRLTERLVELNIWDKCALAVTADHGEEFLDHGGRFHQPWKLAEELVHVPLLLRVPGQLHRRSGAPISLIDLAPTLLEVLELPAPADFRGRSRWQTVQKQTSAPALVVTECVHGCTNPFRRDARIGQRILAVRKDDFKLVINFSSGSDELFDLRSDPAEMRPLPIDAAVSLRKELLQRALRHVVESRKSRDFDRRQALLLRDLRIEWA